MEEENRTGILSIPPELLEEILSLLSKPTPSINRLYTQPFYNITHSTTLDLKYVSYVSHTWRQVVLPILFQHSRMVLSMDDVQTNWPIELSDFLAFVRKNHVESTIHSFMLVILVARDHQPIRRYSHQDESLNSLKNHWTALFNIIDPSRLTIIAPPPILGHLTSLHVDIDSVGNFHMPYHILSLSHSSTSRDGSPWNEDMKTDTITLLNLRPWESLLLNEGSFIRGYNITHRGRGPDNPPSILPSLTQDQESPRLQTIKSVSYIALYPGSAHVKRLAKLFTHVEHVYIQLVPQHDPFPDKLQLMPTEFQMVFMEGQRKWCYRSLIRESISDDENITVALREIRCGEPAVGTAWEGTLEEIARFFPGCWYKDPTREGVLVRDVSKTARSAYDMLVGK
jgi:hypothetical protein